jgi:hypothetical protein
MKYVNSSRRQVVMTVLLSLAVLGAAMRYWAPNPSVARDVGTLLLVMWLPAVGNLVAFAIREVAARRPKRIVAFDESASFVQHLAVHLDASPAGTVAEGERRCTLVVGKEGFSARTALPLSRALGSTAMPRELPLELLRPDVALPKLPTGTHVELMVGDSVVAAGAIVRS